MSVIKCFAMAILASILLLTACASGSQQEQLPVTTSLAPAVPQNTGEEAEGNGQSNADEDSWRIRVVVPSGDEIWSFTEAELIALPEGQALAATGVYSTINNWPSARFYAAEGFSIEGILKLAGVLDTAQTITFRAADGYEVSLTREQLFCERFFYPNVGEDAVGAEPVLPIIAYRWREGSADISELRSDKPSLIFGQSNQHEHTNPAFVIGVAEIVVDDSKCDTWDMASVFPSPGLIAEGETVKLQHQFFGLVKLHYTLDGSDPTIASTMYNPSTYQLELNVPILLTEPTIIKVLVFGYGKNNSDIAEFEFTPAAWQE